MKRISIWLILLALMPGFANADYYYHVPPRYRVHYSPYALRYGSTGLVPGGLDYSVHAVDYHNSGLISEGVRYTPYALAYGSSGLIYAYSTAFTHPHTACPAYYGAASSDIVAARLARASYAKSRSAGERRRDTTSRRTALAHARSLPSTKSAVAKERDGMHLIRQHLRAKGIDRISMNRMLSIDGAIVSADLTITDRNLLIKYWNPEQIDLVRTKAKLKQRIYENYKEDWERFAIEHEKGGGQIYYVTASDARTIVAALDCCPGLGPRPLRNEERPSPAPSILYAKN